MTSVIFCQEHHAVIRGHIFTVIIKQPLRKRSLKTPVSCKMRVNFWAHLKTQAETIQQGEQYISIYSRSAQCRLHRQNLQFLTECSFVGFNRRIAISMQLVFGWLQLSFYSVRKRQKILVNITWLRPKLINAYLILLELISSKKNPLLVSFVPSFL